MKRIVNKICIALLLFTAFGCEKEMFVEDLAGFDPNSDLSVYEVQLTGPGQAAGEIYWDIGQGKVYTYADASKQPEVVDLALLWGTGSASNLIAPKNVVRLDEWATGKNINDEWFVKNETYMVRLEKSAEGLELYNNIKSMADVEAAYTELKTLAENQDNYSIDFHGEGMGLRDIAVGDVIGIRTSKNVYAIALVQSLVTGNAGNLRLSLKLDKRHEIEIDPLPTSEYMEVSEFTADGMTTLDGTNVINLATGQVLSVRDGYYNQNNSDAIIYIGSGGLTLSSPSLDLPIIGEDALEVNSDWEVRHETQFIRLKASAATTTLYNETFTNTLIREAFESGEDIVSAYDDYDQQVYGPGLSVSGLGTGDVVLYYSAVRNVYGAIRITDADTDNIVGKIKANTYERTEVAAPVLKEFTSEGSTAGAAYVDFKNRVVYKTEAEGKEHSANIDVVSARGSTTFQNFFPLANAAGLGAFSAAWRDRVATWPIRNASDIYNLGVTPEAWEMYHDLKEDESMWDAFQTTTSGVTPTQRLYPVKAKQIFFIHSIDRNLLVAIKALDTSTDARGVYRYKIIEL